MAAARVRSRHERDLGIATAFWKAVMAAACEPQSSPSRMPASTSKSGFALLTPDLSIEMCSRQS